MHIVKVCFDYIVPITTLGHLIGSGEMDLHESGRRKLEYFLLGKVLVVNVVKLRWWIPVMYLTVEAIIWFII